jgi:hypothetical protein
MDISPLMATLKSISNKENISGYIVAIEGWMVAGCNEFLIGRNSESLNIIPLRMGYELDDLPWIVESDIFFVMQLKQFRGVLSAEIQKIGNESITTLLSRLPKLPDIDRGNKAIVNAVTKILSNRVLEPHEPGFPKDDPVYWPRWARYCKQGRAPTLGAWLELAIYRLAQSTTQERHQ